MMQKQPTSHLSKLNKEMQLLLHHRAKFLELGNMTKKGEENADILNTRCYRSLQTIYTGDSLDAFDQAIARIQREIYEMEEKHSC